MSGVQARRLRKNIWRMFDGMRWLGPPLSLNVTSVHVYRYNRTHMIPRCPQSHGIADHQRIRAYFVFPPSSVLLGLIGSSTITILQSRLGDKTPFLLLRASAPPTDLLGLVYERVLTPCCRINVLPFLAPQTCFLRAHSHSHGGVYNQAPGQSFLGTRFTTSATRVIVSLD